MLLAEVLYQRRILNVRTSPGLMDAHARASDTTGGPLATWLHQAHRVPNIRHRQRQNRPLVIPWLLEFFDPFLAAIMTSSGPKYGHFWQIF